jgi:hypothetical protein
MITCCQDVLGITCRAFFHDSSQRNLGFQLNFGRDGGLDLLTVPEDSLVSFFKWEAPSPLKKRRGEERPESGDASSSWLIRRSNPSLCRRSHCSRIRISNPIDKAPLSLVHRSVPSYSELDAALSSGPCFLIPFSHEAYFTQGWLQWAQSNLTYLWPDIFSSKNVRWIARHTTLATFYATEILLLEHLVYARWHAMLSSP